MGYCCGKSREGALDVVRGPAQLDSAVVGDCPCRGRLVVEGEAHRAGIDDFHVADLASVLHVNVAAEEEGCVDCDEHRFGTKVGCARRQQLLIGARRGVDECRAVLRDGFSFGEQAEPLDAFCPELVGGPTRKGVVAEHDHAVGVAAHGDDRVGLLP